jgi:hypothetical protein
LLSHLNFVLILISFPSLSFPGLNSRHPVLSDRELAYSSPISLSVADVEKVRGYITSLISEVNKVRDPSPCETTYVLNIDWIKL